ncbi:MAG: M20/M25/M40 family metallo-hydrolase [Candidatus Bathyarchaeota archaeon]|nr:M20/M25/M40 family metallo-hydrolase [Candidatus Bathyarchaeota archaeon]
MTRYITRFSLSTKKQLLERVEADKDTITNFLRGLIMARSPNPPGDTREAASCVARFLDERGIPYKSMGPDAEKPNLVSSVKFGKPGRNLVLNGHIDVFPVGDGAGWKYDPWGGTLVDGRIYGRGACDMKAGTTASIYTFAILHELREELSGRATLTVVSDEESGGRLGSGWLVNNVPEVKGDCCINGEPSSPYTLRFGEKGILWLRVTVRAPGAHGAYTHLSPNPIKIAAKLATDLEALKDIPVPYPADLTKAITEGRQAAERALGPGGADVMSRVSVNIGVISGGLKINMIPRDCTFELDLRLPPGLSKEDIMPHVKSIVSRYPGAEVEEMRYDGPLWSPPRGEMAEIIRGNARLLGIDPKPIISLGGSDLKFWRDVGIPSYYYGPTNHGMGTIDEYVEVDELLHLTKVHLLSAYEYLKK